MEAKEALEVAVQTLDHNYDVHVDEFDEAAAVLRRLIPFVEAIDHYWPIIRELNEDNLREPWDTAFQAVDAAYRAMRDGK